MRIRNKKTGEIKEVSIKELNQYGLGGSVYVKNKLTKLPVFMEEGGEVVNPKNPVQLKNVDIVYKRPVAKSTFDPYQQNDPIVDRGNFSNIEYTKSDQISKERQNTTNKRIAQEQLQQELSARKAKEKGTAFTLPTGATKKYKDMNLKERSYVDAQVLKNKGRWNENQVEQPFLNTFNPITMLYDMGAGLGEAPLMSDVTNSYMPYVTGVGVPLAVGALAGIGAKTTGQFVNNLANPLAGIKNPFKNKNFKSEINWGNWNKEIPENLPLMQEYNAIEQTTKANGTWMKNSDGSKFKGTPEQFVQQNSENFKKAFPDYYGEVLNHNSPNKFNEISSNYFGTTSDRGWYGKGLYTHPKKEYTSIYGDNNYEFYTNSKNKGLINKENYNASKAYNRNYNQEIEFFNKQRQLKLKEIKDNPKDYEDVEFWNKTINNQYNKKLKNLYKEKQEGLSQNINQYTTLTNPQNGEVVIPFNNNVKSAIGNNGMFDMTNPNIYKAVIPAAIGVGALNQKQEGGIIEDDMGQWAHPGQVTKINSNKITMQGVPYPVLGVDNLGNKQMMQPEMDYTFPGQYVTEYPIMRQGGLVKYQEGREVKKSFRDQLLERNGPIVDASAAPILLPTNLNYDKTRVVNNSSAGLTKTQLKNVNQNLKNRAEQEKKQKLEEYKAAKLFHENNPVAKVLGTRQSKPTTVKPTTRELAYSFGAGINDFYDVPGIGIANDFVNPLSLVSKGIISPWAQAPLQAQQSDSYLPYAGAAVSTALTVPMVRPASIAAKTFLNPKNIYTGALKAGEYLTEETALKNAYKINPWAFKANPEAYYHRSPNLKNIVNKETGMLQGFGASEEGKEFNALAGPGNGPERVVNAGKPNEYISRLNLRKPANSQLYFSKGVPLDGGRYNSPKLGMTGQGYVGPYMVEVENVPMGMSKKGRAPKIDPPSGLEGYAVSHRPISVNEAKFYKENWLQGYKQIKAPKQSIDSKLGKVLNKQGFINPVEIVDKFVPRINPFSFITGGPDVMSFSPLNLIPGYGKKLSGTKNQAFRKFGNSIQDVAQRQALSPAGGSKYRMGRDQIVKEGNWAALENPWEQYPGVFEATFDKTVPNNNLSFLQKSNRNGVLITDAKGNFLPEIPLTEPGMQLNRRLPFSTRYVPINKQKLIDGEFQLATQLPHLQSLAEKYGILAAGAGGLGYFVNGKKGAKENIKTLNKYTIDPIIKLYQKADKELNKGPKIYYKKGGQLKK